MPDPDLTEPLRESNRLVAAAKRGEALRAGVATVIAKVGENCESWEALPTKDEFDKGYIEALKWVAQKLAALLEEPDDG